MEASGEPASTQAVRVKRSQPNEIWITRPQLLGEELGTQSLGKGAQAQQTSKLNFPYTRSRAGSTSSMKRTNQPNPHASSTPDTSPNSSLNVEDTPIGEGNYHMLVPTPLPTPDIHEDFTPIDVDRCLESLETHVVYF